MKLFLFGFIFLSVSLSSETGALYYVVKNARVMEETRHEDQDVKKAQRQAFLFALCSLLSQKKGPIEDSASVKKEFISSIAKIKDAQIQNMLEDLKKKCESILEEDCKCVKKHIEALYEVFERKSSNVYNLTLSVVGKYLHDMEHALTQATIS